ncbi:MAG: PEP/pyruvate-binding domain-containing protein [Candidatus Parabeggiatoa sp.]|nr:PEP/pyruvate-binding domain-containing protein [Candidatus Parabeggiatoa sp.]
MFFCTFLKNETDVKMVGSKANALSKMIRLGMPIPTGFCLTTFAYKAHLAQLDVNFKDVGAVYQAILDMPILPDIKETFQQFWNKCEWTNNNPAVAVRSSATAEDLEMASFAGQYKSYLNIQSIDKALDKVKMCWASVWTENAIAYAKQQGITNDNIEMAVIIQEMSPANAAGVVFSAEPVTGDRQVIYLEAVTGLSDVLVSGQDDPSLRVWMDKTGHVFRTDVLSDQSPLPLDSLTDLAKLTTQVDDIFGKLQDIEWTWSAKLGFQLVQSRPITTLPQNVDNRQPQHWMLPGRPERGWTKKQQKLFKFWDEYNPRIVLPLEWDLYEGAIWEVNLRMFDYVGNVPLVEEVAVIVDGVVIGVDPAARCQEQTPIKANQITTSQIKDWEREMQNWVEAANDLSSGIHALSSLLPDELISSIDRAAKSFRNAVCNRLANMQQWIDHLKGNETQIKTIISQILPKDEIENALNDLSAGVEHETSLMNSALWKLMNTVAQQPDILESSNFYQQIEQFLDRFGHFSIEGVPLALHPEYIWSQLRTVAESSSVGINPKRTAKKRFDSIMSRLQKVLDLEQWDSLQKFVKFRRDWIAIRESSKTKQNMSLPLMKRLIHEAGHRLHHQGVIDNIDDVRLLRWSELNDALLYKQSNLTLTDVVLNRKQLIEWKKDHSWLPDGFLGDEVTPDQVILRGDPGSPGIIKGYAINIKGPEDFGKVHPGDIVVTLKTNPTWTQLFGRISGIVVEKGGKISHAAITAREYGIPAVLGINGITSVIKDGENLLVDGNQGEVKRLDLQ